MLALHLLEKFKSRWPVIPVAGQLRVHRDSIHPELHLLHQTQLRLAMTPGTCSCQAAVVDDAVQTQPASRVGELGHMTKLLGTHTHMHNG
jgi:hypothetical protein